ncbi:unnamed protein product [Brassica rapa]|uniref:Uncharacterized protein n=1 Tax=Brassica campestris TaxID=3711 RepID=A0A8D9CQE2_BRACM|nr:unnamed protein product [Brassica rapa]
MNSTCKSKELKNRQSGNSSVFDSFAYLTSSSSCLYGTSVGYMGRPILPNPKITLEYEYKKEDLVQRRLWEKQNLENYFACTSWITSDYGMVLF